MLDNDDDDEIVDDVRCCKTTTSHNMSCSKIRTTNTTLCPAQCAVCIYYVYSPFRRGLPMLSCIYRMWTPRVIFYTHNILYKLNMFRECLYLVTVLYWKKARKKIFFFKKNYSSNSSVCVCVLLLFHTLGSQHVFWISVCRQICWLSFRAHLCIHYKIFN